jgi:DTW domain-containing protein YfiP
MSGALCLCAELHPIENRTRVGIIMHHGEARTSSNTGRLAHALLRNSEVRLRGVPGNPFSAEGWVGPQGTSLVLFPTETAQVLTPEWVSTLKNPVTLIVPDGNWSQARKVLLREMALKDAIPVKLPPGPPSQYRLRKAPRIEAVCTIEAIARALRILEGERGDEVEAHLLKGFQTMVERVLWSRGEIKTEECQTGIPEEAIEIRQKSGFPKNSTHTDVED